MLSRKWTKSELGNKLSAADSGAKFVIVLTISWTLTLSLNEWNEFLKSFFLQFLNILPSDRLIWITIVWRCV